MFYQLMEVHTLRFRSCRDHDVEPSAWAYRTNGLTESPASPIAGNCSTPTDLRDEPHSRPPATIRRAGYDYAIPPGAPPGVQDLAILPAVGEGCKDGHHSGARP
jgi:hypothetical protein